MRIPSNVVVLLSLFTLAACGGSSPGAKEPDPWADYKGTYAGPAEPRGATSVASGEGARHDAKSKTGPKEHVDEAPAKKSSKATIHGESISTIGEGPLAAASKGALKTKLVASKVLVGAQYEELRVQLKGAAVQIIRPAATPDAGTAAVDAPKARSSALSKTQAGWYDEEADVLVIVEAGRKGAAEKALAAILTR